MAKKFLSYGLTKGLSYREDWDKVLGRALQSEALDRQAQQAREEKVRYYADRAKKGHAISERHQAELEEFYKGLNKKVADYPINHPGFETDLNLHMKYNQLLDQYLNNKYLVADKKQEFEWNKFREAMPNLLAREIEENINAYDDYNEGRTDTPYTFYAPKHFDYIPHVQNAVKLISVNPEQFMVSDKEGGIYGVGTRWNPERLREVARGLIADNPDEYEREFQGIKRMGFDYANEEEWVTSVIESFLGPGGVETKGRYQYGRGAPGTGAGSFYLNSIQGRTDSTNDPNVYTLIPTSTDTKKNRWLEIGQEGHVYFQHTITDEDPNKKKKNTFPLRVKPNQFMLERVSPQWKTFDDGRRYARARMKVTEKMFEALNLKEKLNMIGLPHELIEEKVKLSEIDRLTMALVDQGIFGDEEKEEGTGNQIRQSYAAGIEKPEKYWHFDAWVPLSNDPASIDNYNLAHRNIPNKLGLEASYPEFFYGEQSPGYEGMLVEQDGVKYHWTGYGYEPAE